MRHRQELLHREECQDEALLPAGQCAGGGWSRADLSPGLLTSPHQGQRCAAARRCHLLQGAVSISPAITPSTWNEGC